MSSTSIINSCCSIHVIAWCQYNYFKRHRIINGSWSLYFQHKAIHILWLSTLTGFVTIRISDLPVKLRWTMVQKRQHVLTTEFIQSIKPLIRHNFIYWRNDCQFCNNRTIYHSKPGFLVPFININSASIPLRQFSFPFRSLSLCFMQYCT